MSIETRDPGRLCNSPDRGLLLVGHGTRDAAGTREFFELVSVLADRLAPLPVEGCLLEFQHPTIPEAWKTLVDCGVSHVVVAPLLLFAAGHARADIPEAVAACAVTTPGVSHNQSGPLSRAPSIVEILSKRVDQAMRRASRVPSESVGLVMVGRGSHDPCATADMQVLGEIVAFRCGFAQHAVGFYAMAEPRLPQVLDQVATRPGIESVVVQPHLLFQGRLYDAICGQVQAAAERHPEIQFVVGDYLGPTVEVADALSRRACFQSAVSPSTDSVATDSVVT